LMNMHFLFPNKMEQNLFQVQADCAHLTGANHQVEK